MLNSYLASLELRIQGLERLLGDSKEYRQSEIKEVREGISDVLAKVHKDVSRKFERVKKVIDKYSTVVDSLPTVDKITLVHSQLEDLHSIAAQLDRIQKHLPSLQNKNYIRTREEYKGLHLLNNCAKLKSEDGNNVQVEAEAGVGKSLSALRAEHRTNIGELMELNAQVVRNLSSKIAAAKNRRLKQSSV